jgi:hypothetical protein
MFEIENLTELDEWKLHNLDEWFYISEKILPEYALVSSLIFFPKFIEYDGFYIIERNYNAEIFPKSCEFWKSSNNKDRASFEQSWNNVKLFDVFKSTLNEDNLQSVLCQLGKVMELSWLTALNTQFPAEKFQAKLIVSDQNYGPIVTAWSDK